MNLEKEMLDLLEKQLENGEVIEFYFWGENIDSAINKNLAVVFAPVAGLSSEWIGESFVLFTNKFVHIINFNKTGEKVDSFKVEIRNLNNIIYYKGKKTSIFKLDFEDCKLIIAPKSSLLKETNDFLSQKFSVTTKEEEFQNKKSKFINIVSKSSLIIALSAIVICILVLIIK